MMDLSFFFSPLFFYFSKSWEKLTYLEREQCLLMLIDVLVVWLFSPLTPTPFFFYVGQGGQEKGRFIYSKIIVWDFQQSYYISSEYYQVTDKNMFPYQRHTIHSLITENLAIRGNIRTGELKYKQREQNCD